MTRRLPSLAAAMLAAATAVEVAVLARTHQIAGSPTPCAFADGQSYCRMATGHAGSVPFDRRPLVPAIVGVLPGSLDVRFRVVALVSCMAVIALAAMLAYRTSHRGVLAAA